ncbi:MAG: hypothetical protein H6964_18055 [Chromatiaceae bacterium]|nr:hypothetical protein [Chromatiaceae bacterium]
MTAVAQAFPNLLCDAASSFSTIATGDAGSGAAAAAFFATRFLAGAFTELLFTAAFFVTRFLATFFNAILFPIDQLKPEDDSYLANNAKHKTKALVVNWNRYIFRRTFKKFTTPSSER